MFHASLKNILGYRRKQWRIIYEKLNDAENDAKTPDFVAMVLEEKKEEVADVISDICQQNYKLLEHFIIKVSSIQDKVFFHKLKGDLYRYSYEVKERENKNEAKTISETYGFATELAKRKLPATSQIRLATSLNYSVFLYDCMHQTEEAHEEAKSAFDEALEGVEKIDDGDTLKEVIKAM